MLPENSTDKTAAVTKTSEAMAASTTTGGQQIKRKNTETPGPVYKKEKTTDAGEVEADAGGEELIGDDGDDQPDAHEGTRKDDGDSKCLVRPDKAWELVERSHVDKQPAASHKKFLSTNGSVSQLKKAEVDKIIPPKTLPESSFHPKWTQQDEQDLQKAWEEYPDRAVWMGNKSLQPLAKLWKVFLRLFRKSPAEVISAKYALRYHPFQKKARISNDNKDGKVFENSPLWSESFMDKLTYLAYHPLWQGKVECLIVAMQYAVIVRTNDCRPWKLLNPTGDEFFNTMIRFLKKPDYQGMEMPKLHMIARDDMQERGIPCGWFSMFMEKLEGTCPNPPPKQTEDNGPYKVSIDDLKAMLKALTDMNHQGLPLFRYTGEGYGMEATKIPLQDDLPSKNNVKEYHEREILEECRWVAIQKKLADQARPVEDSTRFTVSAEPTYGAPLGNVRQTPNHTVPTGSGSARTEIDQLKEEIRKLREKDQE
ncbi:hypothetical protein K4K61_010075 [Colletotrichum sp. SAR11_59]|uniref:Uncharacterized protein n=1 Tax=Colletotrichum asianum TaxID=702518 RepID=A0A8H3WBN9_9PEZI|nr:hypothetical protein GQ607_006739 [Colletotrichum asianum]KAI8312524.1 hypothetical protein K4K61_010075 [Colletotrichum sp. SAR11_59]